MDGEITLNGRRVAYTDGLTISALLRREGATFRMMVVRVDGALVKKEDYDTCILRPGAVVEAIPLMGGG